QAARVVNGYVYVGHPPPPPSSSMPSSSQPSSSQPSSSSWAALAFSDPAPYEGLVDEIAVFNDALDGAFRTMLYNGGSGSFWHADRQEWGHCHWLSSSWHSSSIYRSSSSSSSPSSHWSSSSSWDSSSSSSSWQWSSSWAARFGGAERSGKA